MATFNYYTGIKKLKINLEYSGNLVMLEVEPYRPIKYLKERASKIFYPYNFDIKLLYANKDLTAFENTSIGEYFKNKNIIHVKVIQIISSNSNPYSNPNSNSNSNSKDEKPFLNKDVKENINFNRSNNSNSPDKNILCSCSIDVISYYCRTCSLFICHVCRMNDEHKLHLSIHVDVDNLKESIKLYAISLQADIKLNLKASKKYSQNFESEKFVDPASRKEMIIRKLDEIERRQESYLQSLPQINEEEINNILNDFEKQGNETHVEIENVLERIYYDYSKKHKHISYEETEKYFSMINNKEKEIEKFNYNVLSYKYNFQVHKKIDEMYKIIEKAIDGVLCSDMSKWTGTFDDSSSLTLGMLNSFKKTVEKQEINNIEIEQKISLNNSSVISAKERNKHEKEAADIKHKKEIPDQKRIKEINLNKNNRISIEAINKENSIEQNNIISDKDILEKGEIHKTQIKSPITSKSKINNEYLKDDSNDDPNIIFKSNLEDNKYEENKEEVVVNEIENQDLNIEEI